MNETTAASMAESAQATENTRGMSPDDGQRPDCSIVIPVYFNEGSLSSTYEALRDQVFSANPDKQFEIIFIDDGSGDGSLAELLRLREADPGRVKVIKLTRNFGQVSAMLAGFRRARGDCLVAMSADGQDPPELINRMLERFDNGTEIVIATRGEREEGLARRLTSRLFYTLMRKLSSPNMPPGGFDYFLLGKRATDAVIRNIDTHPFLQGLILWTGYPTEFFEYTRKRREVGTSRWSFGKKLTYLIDGVMSNSFLPIRLMSITGALVALSGFVYALVILIERLIWGNPVVGWVPLMIVLLILSGIQLLLLGIMGEYVWRTLAESRSREPYLIEREYG